MALLVRIIYNTIYMHTYLYSDGPLSSVANCMLNAEVPYRTCQGPVMKSNSKYRGITTVSYCKFPRKSNKTSSICTSVIYNQSSTQTCKSTLFVRRVIFVSVVQQKGDNLSLVSIAYH